MAEEEVIEEDLVGKTIGNYVLKKLLGKGGMGAVYMAEHPRIEKQVAVKVLSQYVVSQPMAAQRFESEAKLISRISHPNIIEIFDFGALEDGRLYYIMEMLDGRELRKVMKAKRRMSPRDVLPYLEQICAALQAAHDEGVIHRDLKPENIFVLDREPMTLKVLDFGVAKLLETDADVETTAVGVVVGTPLLVAPEQAASKPDMICPATDLYSLGVLLYWILSGRPPFVADAPGILMALHIMDEPPLLTERAPNVPNSVARVIHQCLEKDPAKRPASAKDVYTAFTAAVEQAEAPEDDSPPPIIELSTAMDPWGMSGDSDVISGDSAVSGSGARAVSSSGEREVSITGPMPRTSTGEREVNLTGPMPASSTGPGMTTPAVTTLGGSSGEVPAEAAPGRHSTVLWATVTAVAVLAILAGGVFFYNKTRKKPAPAAAAPPAVKVSPVPPPDTSPAPATQPLEVRRTIKVKVAGGSAICRFKDGEGNIKELSTPCVYEAIEGDEVEVKVTGEGLEPYSRTWTAKKDLALALRIDPESKRIVEPGASPPPVAAKTPRKAAKVKKGKKPRKRKPRKPKKKFIPVGEGTMEVDL